MSWFSFKITFKIVYLPVIVFGGEAVAVDLVGVEVDVEVVVDVVSCGGGDESSTGASSTSWSSKVIMGFSCRLASFTTFESPVSRIIINDAMLCPFFYLTSRCVCM